jgi:hypothetical protein
MKGHHMDRLKEGSTWAGLAGFLGAMASVFPAWAPHLAGLATIAGAVAGMIPDKGAAK